MRAQARLMAVLVLAGGIIGLVGGQAAASAAPARTAARHIGEQKVVNAGKTSSILVNDVRAGTQFHVCAASPSGSPGGPYDADLSY